MRPDSRPLWGSRNVGETPCARSDKTRMSSQILRQLPLVPLHKSHRHLCTPVADRHVRHT